MAYWNYERVEHNPARRLPPPPPPHPPAVFTLPDFIHDGSSTNTQRKFCQVTSPLSLSVRAVNNCQTKPIIYGINRNRSIVRFRRREKPNYSRAIDSFNFKGTVSETHLRWLNTVCAHFTDSVSDAIKRALGLWYANTAVDKVIPQFHMKWITKLSFDPK